MLKTPQEVRVFCMLYYYRHLLPALRDHGLKAFLPGALKYKYARMMMRSCTKATAYNKRHSPTHSCTKSRSQHPRHHAAVWIATVQGYACCPINNYAMQCCSRRLCQTRPRRAHAGTDMTGKHMQCDQYSHATITTYTRCLHIRKFPKVHNSFNPTLSVTIL